MVTDKICVDEVTRVDAGENGPAVEMDNTGPWMDLWVGIGNVNILPRRKIVTSRVIGIDGRFPYIAVVAVGLIVLLEQQRQNALDVDANPLSASRPTTFRP